MPWISELDWLHNLLEFFMITEISNETRKKLQEIELEMLLELDHVCKKIGVNYFLIGGTLLGAVRHQGFIP